MKKYTALFVVSIENLKNLKYSSQKKRVLSIICSNCKNKGKKIFKEEESIKFSQEFRMS